MRNVNINRNIAEDMSKTGRENLEFNSHSSFESNYRVGYGQTHSPRFYSFSDGKNGY